MIDLVKKFFGKNKEGGSALQGEGDLHDIRVATCALFLEMANIDGQFSESEQENIIAILKKEYHVSDEDVFALIEAAKKQLEQSIDLWQFTKLVDHNYSTVEKVHIVEMLWKIVYTDGRLDRHEDYLVHKISNLFHLSHDELIDAKLRILRGRA
jgi:uncharacterized tellurite resistance protein B-like protein